MVCVLATLKVKEDKTSQFEEIFKNLSEEVRSKEPGNIFYQLAKTEKMKIHISF